MGWNIISSVWSLLLLQIEHNPPLEKSLENVDGSFACVYLKEGKELKVFRNTASPLFREGTTFSSVKYGDMEAIDAETIYSIDLYDNEVILGTKFKNINKPFYFG